VPPAPVLVVHLPRPSSLLVGYRAFLSSRGFFAFKSSSFFLSPPPNPLRRSFGRSLLLVRHHRREHTVLRRGSFQGPPAASPRRAILPCGLPPPPLPGPVPLAAYFCLRCHVSPFSYTHIIPNIHGLWLVNPHPPRPGRSLPPIHLLF